MRRRAVRLSGRGNCRSSTPSGTPARGGRDPSPRSGPSCRRVKALSGGPWRVYERADTHRAHALCRYRRRRLPCAGRHASRKTGSAAEPTRPGPMRCAARVAVRRLQWERPTCPTRNFSLWCRRYAYRPEKTPGSFSGSYRASVVSPHHQEDSSQKSDLNPKTRSYYG